MDEWLHLVPDAPTPPADLPDDASPGNAGEDCGHAWIELRVTVPLHAQEPVTGWLWEQGIEGLSEEPAARGGAPWVALRAYLPATAAESVALALPPMLSGLEADFPGCVDARIRLKTVEVRDWNAAWKAHFRPVRVSARLVIRPCWEPYSPEPTDVVVDLDPGMAFGTGTHETTRGCLQALDALLGGPGLAVSPLTDRSSLLDVGTGSGILLVAALKLGMQRGVGVDIDPLAVSAARANLELNGLQARADISETRLEALSECYPLVLANILAPTLIGMAPLLAARMTQAGALVLSGLLHEQVGGVLEAFRSQGLSLEAEVLEGEWRTLVLRPTGGDRTSAPSAGARG